MSSEIASRNKTPALPSPLHRSHQDVAFSLADFPTDWDQSVDYPAISAPLHCVGDLRRQLLDGILWHRPKTKSIYPCPDDPDGRRVLLLDPSRSSMEKPHDAVHDVLQNNPDIKLTTYKLTLSYKDYSVDEILRRILPEDCRGEELPSAFEQIGPICHINLREEFLPYKFWIGKVLLDKNHPSVRTVVTKLGSIDTQFRTFAMEVIAGDDRPGWSEVSVKEEGCVFHLDFQRVYWNSRLAGEHKRMAQHLQQQGREAGARQKACVVADLTAGVGPFTVPLTATLVHNKAVTPIRSLQVFANDLNPASYEYLKINAVKNKCSDKLRCFNLDARRMVHRLQDDGVAVDHFLMNLPKIAPEFLDAFRGYRTVDDAAPLPVLHVYCFAPKTSEDRDYPEAVERCQRALGCTIDKILSIRTVRNVAPAKNMVCLSFELPRAVGALPRIALDGDAAAGGAAGGDEDGPKEPDCKRSKTDGENP